MLTQPVAIRRRVVPRHHVHRAVAGRGLGPRNGMVLAEAEELFHSDFLGGDGERAAYTLPMTQLLVPPGPSFAAFLRRWRTHPELDRTGNDHQRLPLTVHVPVRRRPVLRGQLLDAVQPLLPLLVVIRPLLIHLFQPRFLLPRPQEPFRGRMKPGIGRRPVQILQLRHECLANRRREGLLAEFAEA